MLSLLSNILSYWQNMHIQQTQMVLTVPLVQTTIHISLTCEHGAPIYKMVPRY